MNIKLKYYLSNVVKNEKGASIEAIKNIKRELDFDLPKVYLEILMEFNGGEGEIGKNSLLNLYPVEELIDINKDYIILLEQIPQYFIIGKDAADTGYALHKQYGTFHSFGLMSNFETDFIEFCGNSFFEFIEYIYNK